MTPSALRDWMASSGWTVRKLAARLGVYPSTVQRWRDGSSPIPGYLPLALRSLE